MHYVYLIYSESNPEQVYTGYTTDLKQRFQAHNSIGSTHTSKYKPWKLQAYFAFCNKKSALDFESYLKSGSGRAFAKKHLWVEHKESTSS
ncbi:MAG: GIY-YIG nuclease family protein [Myxococcaceae bacterium]